MNLLDMYKKLTEEEKKEFIKLIIKDIEKEGIVNPSVSGQNVLKAIDGILVFDTSI